jgi:tetratricopeptide (TPR) repeat protein
MRRIVVAAAISLAAASGCSSSSPTVRRAEAPANVTYPIAFGDYQRVYNTTYHVVNRYAVVKKASYRYGEIEAEVGQDNAFLDKTRRTILARIFDAGEYWDVECRVLLQVEDSEVDSLHEHQPRYNWRTIAGDAILETRLNNEIKAALSGGAWDSKQPLVPESRAQAPAGPRQGRIKVQPAEEEEGARENKPSNLRDANARPENSTRQAALPQLGEAEYERVGIRLFERGQYARALQAFRAAREARPDSPYADFLLAQALFATGEYGQSAQAIRSGAVRNPDWSRHRVDVRSFYGETRDWKDHVSKLESFARAHPEDQDASLVLGYMAFFTRDYGRAEQVFDKLEKECPSDGLAASYRRLALVELDRTRGLEEF